MSDAGFSPKTVTLYSALVKQVVASAIGDDGEPLSPRTWNHEFIDMPLVVNQRTPSFTAIEIEQIINRANANDRQLAVLYALLPSTGLRIGEALGLKVTDFHDRALNIQRAIWNRQETTLKTRFAYRKVGLAPDVAQMLEAFIGERKDGYLFRSRTGGPLADRNALRRSLHPILKAMGWKDGALAGFHAFRRFRVTYLRKQKTLEDDCGTGLATETRP